MSENTSTDILKSMENAFDYIYKNKVWGDGTSTPLSGIGSDPDNALPYVLFIKGVISQLSIRSVVDFGHGDWAMWRDYKFDDVNYIGIEIAEAPHRITSTLYENERRTFLLQDITKSEKLPDAELLITKDCLQHLSNREIVSLLKVFTNYRYLIICNDTFTSWKSFFRKFRYYLQIRRRIKELMSMRNPFFVVSRRNNRDIISGESRGLDFSSSPFSDELRGYSVRCQFDFIGSKGRANGIVKRVLFLEKCI